MTMIKQTLLIAIVLTLSTIIFAQGVGINTSGASADASAILDVSSTTQGFLPPRMTETQRDAISSPETGLLIYQTDETSGLYYYNSSAWEVFATGKHYIGESYGGGKVFWVDATGQHGLIATTSDQSASMRWYAGTNGNTRAYGNGIGAGEMNTAIIIASHVAISDDGSTYAARVCADLVITSGGVDYSDWYLPSRYEGDLMYQQKATIGGFTSGSYWCEEHTSSLAWYTNISNGFQGDAGKSTTFRVRAVRTF